MKRISLIILFLILITSLASAQETMTVCLEMTPERVHAGCLEVGEGEPEQYVTESSEYYQVNVYSFKSEVLTSFKLERDFEIDDEGAEGFHEYIDVITLPYYKNAKRLEVLDGRKVMLDLDLSEFAKCNENDVCDAEETMEDCPEECKEQPIPEVEVQPPPEETTTATYAIIIVIGILIFFLFLYLIRKKKTKS